MPTPGFPRLTRCGKSGSPIVIGPVCVKSWPPPSPASRRTFAGIAPDPDRVPPARTAAAARASRGRQPLSDRIAFRAAALSLGVLLAAAGSAGVSAAPAATAAAPGQPPTTRLHYAVSLAGLPIARADLTLTAMPDDRYVTRLTWSTSGLVDVFAGTRGDAVATGRLGRGRPVPATYTLASGEGRKAAKVTLAMAGGAVKSAEALPPSRKTPDLVPLEPKHRVDVLDPLSAVLFATGPKAAAADDVCRRTLPIFDGWTRYDLRLTPKATLPNRQAGVTGPILVCAVRYVPVAGHRADHKVTRFMTDNEDLSVTFGHLEKVDAWIPIAVSVRTLVGTAEVKVDRIVAPATAAAE